jgi:Sec-independent protein translocase protein TatA
MNKILFISIILILIIIIFIIILLFKRKLKIILNQFNDLNEFQKIYDDLNQKNKELQLEIQTNQLTLNNQNTRIECQNETIAQNEKRNKELIQSQFNSIDRLVEEHKAAKNLEYNQFVERFTTAAEKLRQATQIEINDWTKSAQEAANLNLQFYLETLNEEKSGSELELQNLQAELEDYRKKRNANNQQILREEKLRQGQDFHRILLTDTAKNDIGYLLSIEHNIHNKELLHKLIWSEYIQKPFQQTLKNVLGNRDPRNVIYCIENINTHKKYIGKTQGEVSKRWINHIKASLSIGTISHQSIHDALFAHWDDFTFSILEEVENESLSDREKYYISFFETDKYGYNLKVG